MVMPLPMPEATPPVTMTYFMSRRTRDGELGPPDAPPRLGEDTDGARMRDGERPELDDIGRKGSVVSAVSVV